jgi:riboflavin biosynthesis pyrimidine reductase
VKPHVICHMSSSIDGRTLPTRWRPREDPAPGLYERIHQELKGDAWLIGRVTGEDFAKGARYPNTVAGRYPRETWLTRRGASSYAVVLDGAGRLAWGRSEASGDPIVVVLTEQISDAHLAGLRADGVSYLFAGEHRIDLALALELLNRELGITRLLLEGGGTVNGSFLRAGLVDELSLLIEPAVDGAKGAPSVFDSIEADAGPAAALETLTLESSQVLEGGAAWLRYRLRNRAVG